MLVTAFGDLIAQTMLEKCSSVNFQRNCVVGSYGFLESVLEGHFWFGLLERIFGPSMTLRTSLLKMACDQTLFSPLEVSSFLVWTHVMERRKVPTLGEKLRADLPATLMTSYLFWMPASLLNFYIVPFHLRALYTGIMCVVWDTFMSFASHNQLRESLKSGSVVNH